MVVQIPIMLVKYLMTALITLNFVNRVSCLPAVVDLQNVDANFSGGGQFIQYEGFTHPLGSVTIPPCVGHGDQLGTMVDVAEIVAAKCFSLTSAASTNGYGVSTVFQIDAVDGLCFIPICPYLASDVVGCFGDQKEGAVGQGILKDKDVAFNLFANPPGEQIKFDLFCQCVKIVGKCVEPYGTDGPMLTFESEQNLLAVISDPHYG